MLSAYFMSFAHGGNDVSNAIGPLAAALSILQGGLSEAEIVIPNDVLDWGGFGIVVGLAISIVCIQVELPISATHTLVGAVMGVSFARGFNSIRSETVKEIATSCVVKIPVGAFFAVSHLYMDIDQALGIHILSAN
ncbi:hypothetical protein HAX54_016817 [Datura stramonium]|uniref:Phosphate transporter n=1 Tax=Datura stramonium TaxID=4076 RepID=A0ABS8ULW8_DATST|nr:hypothetical protein [Datura stramonium]